MFTVKNVLITLAIIVLDFFVYLVLSMLLMNYDDFYDESMGPYWSLESMTLWQKVNYIGLNVWSIVNAVVILFIVYNVILRLLARRNMNH